MFSPFDNNNNERREQEPRFIFANFSRPGRTILTAVQYQAFSGATVLVWLFLVIIVWVIRLEVTVSQDLMTSIAGSSVELAGLSLAVLGILHEFNKTDKWFKVGLFLVAVLFAGVVLNGFFLSLTWKPEFDLPQVITVVFVGILTLVLVLQTNWRITFLTRIKQFKKLHQLTLFFQRLKPYIPFALPFFFIWSPSLNRITATILLFVGAMIALVVLMGVTTVALVSQKQDKADDPFLDTLRARYENEVQTLIRVGEIKVKLLDVRIYTGVRSGMRRSPSNKEPNASQTLRPCLRIVEM